MNQKDNWEDILKPNFFAGNAELFEDLHIFDSHIKIDNVDTHEIFNITINEAIFIRDGDEKNGVLDFFAVKEEPKGSDEDLNLTFLFMDISNQKFNIGKIIEINSLIGSICEKLNVEAYLVGGFTRDCIIGIPIKDIDIVEIN